MSNENPFAKWPHIDAAKQPEADSAAPRRELPGSTTEGPAPMSNQNALENFLGGTPASVFVKLLFISLVVGALLMWLDISPADVVNGVIHFFQRIWDMGFDAIRQIGRASCRERVCHNV